MNLFDNAIKYSYPDSVVQVRNWIQKKTNYLLAEVKSKSVPFDNYEKIFELGVRGRHAEDRTSAGSGIGLHICKLIVTNVFGGRIQGVYQKDGDWAVFTISIPGAFLKES